MNNKFSGSKRKRRKPIPQPPKYYWLDSDNCWWCLERSNCRNCKVLKSAAAAQKSKKRKCYL